MGADEALTEHRIGDCSVRRIVPSPKDVLGWCDPLDRPGRSHFSKVTLTMSRFSLSPASVTTWRLTTSRLKPNRS